MMLGSYPCCDESLMLAMPDRTPAFAPEECPHCGAKVWHYFSRIDPKSYTEADFLKEFDVDDVTKTIKPKD